MNCFESIKGLIIKNIEGIEKDSEEVKIYTECGRVFKFYHYQDCCEQVYLGDFEITSLNGLESFVGSQVISIEETTDTGSAGWGTVTWTFYTINTTCGHIWLRWIGESNGYYSEEVSFIEQGEGLYGH